MQNEPYRTPCRREGIFHARLHLHGKFLTTFYSRYIAQLRSPLPLVVTTGVLSIAFLLSACSPHRTGEYGYLEQADAFSREGNYSAAIDAYRAHMKYRLSLPTRPEWENPYFYLLLIGDIQIGQGQMTEALATYELAEENQVDAYLISDRFRGVARWYEQHDQLREALSILERYRSRDPLLFETMADRIAKELTRREDYLSASPPERDPPIPAQLSANATPGSSARRTPVAGGRPN